MTVDPQLPPTRKITLLGRDFAMPQSRRWRITIGILLIIGGCLGFLPILGFWMVPLGLVILSYEYAWVRRRRRRVTVWWGRRRQKPAMNNKRPPRDVATAGHIGRGRES
ncbi:PGPGW domain-containing protein [Tianweitania sp.]|uniref:PGPGW domain-containing protein n=1 Tax=Tianweitania sp. TaxID=2021634 RepID=UPI0028A27D72|nr:PGPGW domain-containing protein [Tianweitania sp.]